MTSAQTPARNFDDVEQLLPLIRFPLMTQQELQVNPLASLAAITPLSTHAAVLLCLLVTCSSLKVVVWFLCIMLLLLVLAAETDNLMLETTDAIPCETCCASLVII